MIRRGSIAVELLTQAAAALAIGLVVSLVLAGATLFLASQTGLPQGVIDSPATRQVSPP
jgi:hypothetical protein